MKLLKSLFTDGSNHFSFNYLALNCLIRTRV